MKNKYLKQNKTHKRRYRTYIKSKLWRKKVKKLILKRRGKVCVVCYTREKVHTHHMTYKRLTKERPDDLVFLCEEHHFKLHDMTKTKVLTMQEGLMQLKAEHRPPQYDPIEELPSYDFRAQNEHLRFLSSQIPRSL